MIACTAVNQETGLPCTPNRRCTTYCCCGVIETRVAVLLIGLTYIACAILMMSAMVYASVSVLPLIPVLMAVCGYIFDHHYGFFLMFVCEMTMAFMSTVCTGVVILSYFNHNVFRTVLPYLTQAVEFVVKDYIQKYFDHPIPVNMKTLLFWIGLVFALLAGLHYWFAYLIADAFKTMRHNRSKTHANVERVPIEIHVVDTTETDALLDV